MRKIQNLSGSLSSLVLLGLLVVMIMGCNNPFVPPKAPKPAPPELIHPRDGDTLGPGNVTFSWKPVPNRHIYHLQVSTTPTFDPCIDVKTVYPSVTIYLKDTMEYYWHVRVETKKYLEWSDWSEKRDFLVNIVANRAPHKPHNPIPYNGAINISTDVNLYWTSGDPDGDTVVYIIYFERDSTSLDSIDVVVEPSGDTLKEVGYYKLPILGNGLTYYWKIIATDQWGKMTIGDIWRFTTRTSPNSPPDTPVVTIPAPPHYIDEVYIFNAKTTDPEGDAVSYKFDFGDGNQSAWTSFVPSGQQIKIPYTYTQLGTFYIKAKAMDTPSCNESKWSDSVQLTIKVGPGAVWVADVNGWKVTKLTKGGTKIYSYFFCTPATDSCHPEFKQPVTIDVNRQDGSVWIACTSEERVFHISRTGKFICMKLCGANTNPSTPNVDENGDCWVSLAYAKRIVKFDPTCNIVKEIPDNLPGDIYPVAIALDKDSNWIWAVEAPGPLATNGYVSKFDINTHNRLLQLPGFKGIWAEVDPVTHYCWVVDLQNNQIAKISPSGEVTRYSGFNEPVSLSIDYINQWVWVADRGNHRIVKLSYAGVELLRLFGFNFPAGVEVDPNDGSCWISDTENSRIVKVSANGNFLFEVSGFITPMGLCVNSNPDP